MPEGPECHHMSVVLKNRIIGKYILSIATFQDAKTKNLEYLQLPAKVLDVYGRGKRPVIVTDKGYIVTFLSMTGRWLFEANQYTRVIFTLGSITQSNAIDIQNSEFEIYYDDLRKFGFVEFLSSDYHYDCHFSNFGPDLIISTPTFEEYNYKIKFLAKQDWQICQFLLEPKYYSTIGNYLKSEILYLCRLRPDRTLASLSEQDVRNLLKASTELPRYSYQFGGLSIENYLSPNSEPGTYPKLVYDREGQQDIYGYTIVRSEFKDKRSTYWVKEIQV